MFDVIKTVISAGGYKLTEIQYKIKKMYFYNDLTEAQMDELLALASHGVSTDAERPENLELIRTLATEIEALKNRVAVLEGGNDAGGVEQPEHPEWKPWDGISKDYQKGAIVSHNGELWVSVFNGQNVWQPGTVGTESMWVKYSESADS